MRRRPIVAFLLGIPIPGLGHVYAGRPGRGLAGVLILGLVALPVAVQLMLLVAVTPAGVLAGYALAFLPALALAADAARVAGKREEIPSGRLGRVLLYAAWPLLAAGIVLGGIQVLLPVLPLRAFRVPTGSMRPAILPGEMVVARMKRPSPDDLVRGRILVFDSPAQPGTLHMDRLVALPGETVEIRDLQVYIDGEPLEEPYKVHETRLDAEAWKKVGEGSRVDEEMLEAVERRRGPGEPIPRPLTGGPLADWGPVTVPDDSVVLLGDNRDNARDSRAYGPIPVAALRGWGTRTLWSRNRETGAIRWSRVGAPL